MRFALITILCQVLFIKGSLAQHVFDFNAQAYIHQAKISSITEKQAIHKLVRSLKYYNIWDDIHALYLPTGGTELSHKLNLKDPRDADDAFRLVYPNGASHTKYGTDWNGIDQGALTFYSPTSTRLHLMVYQDEPSTQPYIFSGYKNGVTDYNSYTWAALFTNNYIGFANQGNYNVNPILTKTGFFYGQRISNDSTKGYVNGSLVGKWYQPFSPYYNTDSSQKIWINKSSSANVFRDTARYQVISMGNCLTDLQVSVYYNIIQSFLSELGIQVGLPIDWPEVPNEYKSTFQHNYLWTKATDKAVDTAIDGVHLYGLGDSLFLWGGWNGSWFPYNTNSGYVSGDGGQTWSKIGQAPWNLRHSAAYGVDSKGIGYLIGSDLMPLSSDVERKEVWITKNGREWELQDYAPWSGKLVLHGLAIKDSILFIGGGQFGSTISSNSNDTIWRSIDGGKNWEVVNSNAPFLGGILYNNFKYFRAINKFVAFTGGKYDDDPSLREFSNEIWTSDDCISWVKQENIPFAARKYSDMVEWDNRLWVFGGDRPSLGGSESLNLKDMWFMDSLGKWHEAGSSPLPERHATGITVDKKNDQLILACGNMHTDVWRIQKSIFPELFSFPDTVLYLSDNCSFIVPDYIDSLSSEFGAHASFTQIPVPGSILNSSPGQNHVIKIFADFGKYGFQNKEFSITVLDTTSPRIRCLGDVDIILNNSCSYIVPDFISALEFDDNCDQLNVSQVPAAGEILYYSGFDKQQVSIVVSDLSGNTDECNFNIIMKDTTAPVIRNVRNIIQASDLGQCNGVVNLIYPEAIDNCSSIQLEGQRSDGLNFNDPFPCGETLIHWTATDSSGNQKTEVQLVKIFDREKPVINYIDKILLCGKQDNFYSLPGLVCNDNCGVSSIVYSITGATNRQGTGIDASGFLNPGVNILKWMVTDLSGNLSIYHCQVIVGNMLDAKIDDVFAVPQGGLINTGYIGYAPSLQLRPEVSGGIPPFKYIWSNNDTSEFINISDPAGKYTYTVLVSDSFGCTAEASKLVEFVDIKCGAQENKVSVCIKNANNQIVTACVSVAAVQPLLENNGFLGSCVNNITNIESKFSPEEVSNHLLAAVMPNPSSSQFTLNIQSLDLAPVQILVINSSGVIVEKKQNISHRMILNIGNNYAPGIYFLEIVQGRERLVFKLVKL